jgi:hypothetical protein
MDDQDKITLTLIRGEIAGLPQHDQDLVKANASKLRELLSDTGQHGMLAFALVGAELQVMAA